MYRKTVILLGYETRERLKEVGRKSQTYDQLINELIDSKQKQESRQETLKVHDEK